MAMTKAEVQTILDNLDTAITNALQAQSYSIGSRSKSNASLTALMNERRWWQSYYDRLDNGAKDTIRNPIFGPGSGAVDTDNGIDP